MVPYSRICITVFNMYCQGQPCKDDIERDGANRFTSADNTLQKLKTLQQAVRFDFVN